MRIAILPFEKAGWTRLDATSERRASSQVTATDNRSWLSQNPVPLKTQLIRPVAQDEREAFDSLDDRYSKLLYSFAIRILNDSRETEDVLWDVAPHRLGNNSDDRRSTRV